MSDNKTILTVENIHKRFKELAVLKGISLTAKQGDVISVLGSSGSGKSTFLRCINFLETPDKGRVALDDLEVNITEANHHKLQISERKKIEAMRTQLGMVFQGFNLWTHKTILENVMEGPIQVLKRDKETVRKEALEYLGKVGLVDKAESYPAQLSGGQKQRAAIARALAMQPKVLLFDEPTSALDPELVGEILKVIRDLAAEGRTMIIVTHEMGFARDVSNRIIFLHEGQIEEDGTPEQVFDNSSSARVKAFLQSAY